MECIVLAGGLGSRLRSVVSDLPKCMAPVCDHPFLFYVLKYLEKNGVNHVILSLGYKHEEIEKWVKNLPWLFSITFVIENEPLGTGGAIKMSLDYTDHNEVYILNGDTYFDVDLREMLRNHNLQNADITIALKKMYQFDRYGNVKIDENNRIHSFYEKNFCEEGQINGGIYLLNKGCGIMNHLEGRFSFETDILQKNNNKNYMNGFLSNGYFIDIGLPEDYLKANVDFKSI